MLAERYASFDAGKGKGIEDGKLTLEQVVEYACAQGRAATTSGKQELYEAIVNLCTLNALLPDITTRDMTAPARLGRPE